LDDDRAQPASGNIPAAYESSTVELCYAHDLICAPGLRASVSTHTSYTSSELADVGIWGADN